MVVTEKKRTDFINVNFDILISGIIFEIDLHNIQICTTLMISRQENI